MKDALCPLGPFGLIDRSVSVLGAHASFAFTVAAASALPLAFLYLIVVTLTGPGAPAWVHERANLILLVLCALAALLLFIRHAMHHLLVASIFDPDDAGTVRFDPERGWESLRRDALKVAATGALRTLIACGAFACALLPAFLVVPRHLAVVPVGVFERKFTEKALARSWRLSDRIGRATVLGFGLILLACASVAVALNFFFLVPWLADTARTFIGFDLGLPTTLAGMYAPFPLHCLAAALFVLIDPLVPIVAAVFYVDVKVKTEGLDLDRRISRMRNAGCGMRNAREAESCGSSRP